jgi:hypothetical protein
MIRGRLRKWIWDGGLEFGWECRHRKNNLHQWLQMCILVTINASEMSVHCWYDHCLHRNISPRIFLWLSDERPSSKPNSLLDPLQFIRFIPDITVLILWNKINVFVHEVMRSNTNSCPNGFPQISALMNRWGIIFILAHVLNVSWKDLRQLSAIQFITDGILFDGPQCKTCDERSELRLIPPAKAVGNLSSWYWDNTDWSFSCDQMIDSWRCFSSHCISMRIWDSLSVTTVSLSPCKTPSRSPLRSFGRNLMVFCGNSFPAERQCGISHRLKFSSSWRTQPCSEYPGDEAIGPEHFHCAEITSGVTNNIVNNAKCSFCWGIFFSDKTLGRKIAAFLFDRKSSWTECFNRLSQNHWESLWVHASSPPQVLLLGVVTEAKWKIGHLVFHCLLGSTKSNQKLRKSIWLHPELSISLWSQQSLEVHTDS